MQKINSLQIIRAIAFLGVFICHAKCRYHYAGAAVSIFFVLSGFLMTLTNLEKDIKSSFVNNILFACKKIKYLYFLHIITMSVFVIYFLLKDGFSFLLLAKTIMFSFCLHAWYPSVDFCVSLDGPSWYLSVTLFAYFVFPYILRYVKNFQRKNIGKILLLLVLIILYQLFFSWMVLYFNISGIDGNFYNYFTYICPVFRISDFIGGMLLAVLYKKINFMKINTFKLTSIEILSIIVFIVINILRYYNNKSFLFNLFFNRTLCYFPICSVIVLLFAINGGVVSKELSKSNVLLSMGDISSYAFLIHYPFTFFTFKLFSKFCIRLEIWQHLLLIIFLLFITLVTSSIYKKLEYKFLR